MDMSNASTKIRIILLLDPKRLKRLNALKRKAGESRQTVIRRALDAMAEKEGIA